MGVTQANQRFKNGPTPNGPHTKQSPRQTVPMPNSPHAKRSPRQTVPMPNGPQAKKSIRNMISLVETTQTSWDLYLHSSESSSNTRSSIQRRTAHFALYDG